MFGCQSAAMDTPIFFSIKALLMLCINIAVLLRCVNHNQPVPCNELNTVNTLLEGPVVETRADITCLYFMVRKLPSLLITHRSRLHVVDRKRKVQRVNTISVHSYQFGTDFYNLSIGEKKHRS